jgi:hypothetical protein
VGALRGGNIINPGKVLTFRGIYLAAALIWRNTHTTVVLAMQGKLTMVRTLYSYRFHDQAQFAFCHSFQGVASP